MLKMQMAAADGSARASMSRFASGLDFKFVAAAALVSGVLGACLVRKKEVDHCSSCGVLS